MKKLALILPAILCFTLLNVQAQDDYNQSEMRTLTGPGRSTGGFGAFTAGYSLINNRDAFEFGFRGMLLINHSIALGFGGTGFANEPAFNTISSTNKFIAGGYSGFIIEPLIAPMLPVHVAFPILIGGGGLSQFDTEWDSYESDIPSMEFFLLIEPGAEVELNVSRFFRVGAGVSYRIPYDFGSTGGGLEGVSPSALKGFSYHLALKFGKF